MEDSPCHQEMVELAAVGSPEERNRLRDFTSFVFSFGSGSRNSSSLILWFCVWLRGLCLWLRGLCIWLHNDLACGLRHRSSRVRLRTQNRNGLRT